MAAGKELRNSEAATFVSLMQTYRLLSLKVFQLMKEYGLTEAQYNILRILEAASESELPVLEVRDRMITRVPDITRLVDRMVKQRFVRRNRSAADGRVVLIALTDRGRNLLVRIEEPLIQLHKDQLGHMSKKEMSELREVLKKARQFVS